MTREEVILSTMLKVWRNGDGSPCLVGFTAGRFDMLHPGHLHLLTQAKMRCDRLVVGVNVDGSKGNRRSVQTPDERLKMVRALRVVDYAILYEQRLLRDLIVGIDPGILFAGDDYRLPNVVGSDHVYCVLLVPRLHGVSTTELRERV